MSHLSRTAASRSLGTACRALLPALFSGCLALSTVSLVAQEAQWIWSPEHQANHVPPGACHFRKSIRVNTPERAEISILADDE